MAHIQSASRHLSILLKATGRMEPERNQFAPKRVKTDNNNEAIDTDIIHPGETIYDPEGEAERINWLDDNCNFIVIHIPTGASFLRDDDIKYIEFDRSVRNGALEEWCGQFPIQRFMFAFEHPAEDEDEEYEEYNVVSMSELFSKIDDAFETCEHEWDAYLFGAAA